MHMKAHLQTASDQSQTKACKRASHNREKSSKRSTKPLSDLTSMSSPPAGNMMYRILGGFEVLREPSYLMTPPNLQFIHSFLFFL
jgi:hypothetical protein